MTKPRAVSFPLRAVLSTAFVAVASVASAQPDRAPLPSWNDGDAKRAIVTFVERVTKEGGPDYVPREDRIAVFDNDGTLWCEQPFYFQALFALDRVKAMAPDHP
ncbi:MAG: haloacid dehalogenase-like hydrolase, partial [Planctomycetaceae bacterium]